MSSEGSFTRRYFKGIECSGGYNIEAQTEGDLRFIIQTGTIRETTAYSSRIRFLPSLHASTRRSAFTFLEH